jgi:ketosteroid isomerase-like protein
MREGAAASRSERRSSAASKRLVSPLWPPRSRTTRKFHDWSIRAERLIDARDDQVIDVTHQPATGRESGVPVELKLWQLADIKDGRHVRVRNYLPAADALEAAGLSGTGTERG